MTLMSSHYFSEHENHPNIIEVFAWYLSNLFTLSTKYTNSGIGTILQILTVLFTLSTKIHIFSDRYNSTQFIHNQYQINIFSKRKTSTFYKILTPCVTSLYTRGHVMVQVRGTSKEDQWCNPPQLLHQIQNQSK